MMNHMLGYAVNVTKEEKTIVVTGNSCKETIEFELELIINNIS